MWPLRGFADCKTSEVVLDQSWPYQSCVCVEVRDLPTIYGHLNRETDQRPLKLDGDNPTCSTDVCLWLVSTRINHLRIGVPNFDSYQNPKLVGGFKHFLFSISYMGCHSSHWRTPSFFKMVIAPPTRKCRQFLPKLQDVMLESGVQYVTWPHLATVSDSSWDMCWSYVPPFYKRSKLKIVVWFIDV